MLIKNMFVLQHIFAVLVVLATFTVSRALTQRTGFKRFYHTGLGECSDCDYHGRDYQWCKTGPGPDDWMHCSTTGGVTSKGKNCRSDHKCKYHGKEYLWCFTEEGMDNKAWGYCSWVEDTTKVPYTVDGQECYSHCKKRDGINTCRTESGALTPCKTSDQAWEEFVPELVKIASESLTPEDEAVMDFERKYWEDQRNHGEL